MDSALHSASLASASASEFLSPEAGGQPGSASRVGQLSIPELLAPAGNMTCLHAAVRAGADAVYLGAGDFNARRGADNFTIETLREACDWAHVRGVRIYLTVNIVVLPSEVDAALNLVRDAWQAGVDAFIVQDVGLALEIGRLLPEAEVHISTQMNTHNTAGVQAAAALGATRVTLAREMSLPEIAQVCEAAHGLGMQVEAFGHGALCVCYSGQCFMSSLVGGRSANRGMCAQACRLPYELHSASLRKSIDVPGEHLLSPKDLWTIDLLPQLAEAGVDSLKIEGRMKSPEYVYAVVSVYRTALNRLKVEQGTGFCSKVEQGTGFCSNLATEEEKQRLSEAFSRGFTTAYLTGETGQSMMSYGRPNNRGVRVGRVSAVRDGLVEVDCETPLVVGDVIEFWTNKGHFAHTISALEARGGNTVALVVPKPVGKGDRVFRVRSAEAAFEDSAQDPRVPVQGSIELRIGKPARLTLGLPSPVGGFVDEVVVEGPIVEAARTKAISAEDVRDHIDRFGTTPFELETLDVQMDEGVGMGFSTLHHLRAEAAEKLQQKILTSFAGRRNNNEGFAGAQSSANRKQLFPQARQRSVQVCAWATNPACARAARKAKADAIYVPALNYKRGEAVVAGQRTHTAEQAGYPKQLTIALPTITHEAIEGSRELAHGFNPWKYVSAGKPVFADNLGDVFRALAEGMQVEVGPHMPVTNALTAQYFADLGVARIWLSPELTLGQIQRITEVVDVPFGLFISGAAELMVTEHCLLQAEGPCAQQCETCPRRTSPHYLKDRKGFEMPVITDCCGRSHLYNAVPLDLAHLMPDLVGAGITAVMVDTTLLNTSETADAVARAVRARDLVQRTGDSIGKREGTTTGHLFRGVS